MAADIIISIIVPWRLTSDRYWFEFHSCSCGVSSSARMNIPFSPAMKKKPSTVTKYWRPTTLWSVQSLK